MAETVVGLAFLPVSIFALFMALVIKDTYFPED